MVKTRSQSRSTDVTDFDVRGRPPKASDSDADISDGETAQHQRQIAKARLDHKAINKAELSFHVGDEITELKEIGPTLWEGVNRATLKKGLFHKDHVLFLLETKEAEQHVRFSPTRIKQIRLIPLNESESPSITSKEKGFLQIIQKNVFATLVAVIAAVGVLLYIKFGPHGLTKSGKMRVNITELKNQFSSQEPDMWDTLKAGLLSSRSEGVQTFLFLHNSPRTAVCFLKKLSDNSCVAYRANDVSNSEAFVLDVKKKLLAHKCLVMFDLEDLHPDGVAVLKGFCDAYQPIVPDTKFFFALNAGTQLDTEVKKLARNLLESKWSGDFTHDEFGGTLTRLTQNVLKIHTEPNVPC